MNLQEQILDAKKFADQFFQTEAIIRIEEYSKERFGNLLCPSVTNGHTIVFNRNWINSAWLDNDDIPFFLTHELRHLYQQEQIRMHNAEQKALENKETIRRWEYEWTHYIRNMGDPVSRKNNLLQEIEMDANGYSMALLILKHINESWSPLIRMENDQFDMSIERGELYINTRPELQRWARDHYHA